MEPRFLMKVSIIIPTYNCAELLTPTLRSIQLGGWEDLEVIVVDGASGDSIAAVVKSFGGLVTEFVSEPDEGQYDAINKGMNRATGDVLCWLNAGDVFLPGGIANAVSIFEALADIDWIIGRPCVSEGIALRVIAGKETAVLVSEIRCGLCSGRVLGHLQQEGMFWRRSLWEMAGPLDTQYRLAADFDLWIRFSRTGSPANSSVPLAAFSHHGTNRSIVQREEYIREMEAVIETLPAGQKRLRSLLKWFSLLLRMARSLSVLKPIHQLVLMTVPKRKRIPMVSWEKDGAEGFQVAVNPRVHESGKPN
jgi:glycosyltransferase involved in cell wall biosynthesis